MSKISGVLATFVGLGILMIGFRPAFDELFLVMNTTKQLTGIESIVWELVPIVLPLGAVVGGILLLARRRENRREGGETRW